MEHYARIFQKFPDSVSRGFSFKKDDIKVLMKCGMGRFCFLKNSLLTFSPFKLIIKIKIFNVTERRGERKA